MNRPFLLILLLFITNLYCPAQEGKILWDNSASKNWPEGFVQVEIKSSADGEIQKAVFFRSTSSKAQPLVVSLHTWSGDYLQEDPLAEEVILRDWNYIHPDFRGPNNNPEACGSQLVITDMEDAIRYAIRNARVDTTNIHIIGASGGGYATLLAYMKLDYPVRSFNAWAGISNLSEWYWESKGRNQKYASDLEKVAMNNNNRIDFEELNRRSPMIHPYPAGKRKNATLNIFTGIHDGYTGSVPISHSVLFYNKIVKALYPFNNDLPINDDLLISLLTKRMNPDADSTHKLGGRRIHLRRESDGLNLILFEGGHEMLANQALALIPADENRILNPLNILTIGDSNGASEYGWPQQLKKLMPYATIINHSVPGNTIGFNNLDQSKLNTLSSITTYIDETYKILVPDRQLDIIVIGLGTNDAKKIFKDRQNEVPVNMELLVQKIRSYIKQHNKKLPVICILSSPPMDENKIDTIKYGGGDQRIRYNNRLFKKIAEANKIKFIDTYPVLQEGLNDKTSDGIHLTKKAQFEIASVIVQHIKKEGRKYEKK